jgi:hypothetical protein
MNGGRCFLRIMTLAKKIAKEGEMRFAEIASVLRVPETTLRRWLESEKSLYVCRLDEGKTALVSTPGEAEMWFACFDCDAKTKGICRGFGDSNSPETFSVLIAQLEANDIKCRTVQSRYFSEVYGIDLSPQQISEYVSRGKNGKHVPADIVNLRPRKKNKRKVKHPVKREPAGR